MRLLFSGKTTLLKKHYKKIDFTLMNPLLNV